LLVDTGNLFFIWCIPDSLFSKISGKSVNSIPKVSIN
jgi:hypothetical protein